VSYDAPEYAASLQEFGTPRRLNAGQGWVLQRPLVGGGWDVVGCYPFFRCRNWDGLVMDLDQLRQAGCVSATIVTDPLASDAKAAIQQAFTDVARPFKAHFIVDLSGHQAFGSKHHLRNVRRFEKAGTVELCSNPLAHLDDWCRFYDKLIQRHQITGMARFSPKAFAAQLALPSAVLFRALVDGQPVGMQLWFTESQRADYHLAGYSDTGYQTGGASHALTLAALEHFRHTGTSVALLGSGAGLQHDANDGLTRYKAGWATDTRTAWLAGAILDPVAYAAAAELSKTTQSEYFPAYRTPVTGSGADIAEEERVHAH
jgi:hypothetical protein